MRRRTLIAVIALLALWFAVPVEMAATGSRCSSEEPTGSAGR